MARSAFASRTRALTLALLLGTALTAASAAAPALANPLAPAAQPAATGGSYAVAMDTDLIIRPDRTEERLTTTRIKILGEAALQAVGQQMRGYTEGMQTLDIVEAYTEKADGRKIQVDPTAIITRDGVNGPLMLFLDIKVRTIIFPDIAVGDTLVMVTRENEIASMFPGHYSSSFYALRSLPLAQSTLRVTAPKSLGLRVAVEGAGLTSAAQDDGDTIVRTITYRPQPKRLDEPGSISAADRDARVLISTFKNYEEMGRAYWSEAAPKAAVTPEIAALAEDITKGVTDPRAQAEAISRWIKRNIRYVAVYLGAARVVPNPAPTILQRKYGDCKDQVTLMTALLAAKGISSEQVLIQMGDGYAMPEPPTMASINHVMVYLPAFNVYDDPTGSLAGFGVLTPSTYDKPVIHVSAKGAHLARTPNMNPEDHVVTNRTSITVAADGRMTGTTHEIATGIFAAGLRGTAGRLQHNGLDLSAEQQLRGNGTPGKGRFDVSALAELAEPYVVKSTFNIAEPAKFIPGGSAVIPFGLGTRTRPGGYLLGTRFENRTLPFVCFAGRMIEEIDLTFAEGLPMPRAFRPITIGNRWFTYKTDHKIEDRTMKIRREFTAHVAGQVCGPEVEAESGKLLQQVSDSIRIRMSFAPAPKKDPSATKPQASPAPAQLLDRGPGAAADRAEKAATQVN